MEIHSGMAVAAWMVFPAPLQALALLAVPLCEGWGLWLVLPAILGVMQALRVIRADRWAWASLVAGVTTMVWATAPLRALVPVAVTEAADISVWRALVAGLEGDVVVTPQTHEFHRDGDVVLQLDALIPDGTGPFPTAVVVHPGGWRGGDKSDFPEGNAWLLQRGFAVFDVQYRLEPAPNWKAAVGDVKCAIRWVKRNAERFHLRDDGLTLLGRSAGAHLVMLVAGTPGHPLLPSTCEGDDPAVKQVVAFYGPTDLVYGYHNPANLLVYDGPATLRRFLGTTPDEDRMLYELMSPVTHVTPRMPRTLLFHGAADQYVRVRQMELMVERLKTMRVEHRAVVLPHAQHGFDFAVRGLGWQLASEVMGQFLDVARDGG
ncbi:MAG: alpha/beta hydrolase [Myxococcota bacterium]